VTTPSCLFDEFNVRYWHGRLPRYHVLRGHHDGGLGWCVDATRTIMVDHTLTGEALELVLLHEMAHIGSAAARSSGGSCAACFDLALPLGSSTPLSDTTAESQIRDE
jgi:hypothetical protein